MGAAQAGHEEPAWRVPHRHLHSGHPGERTALGPAACPDGCLYDNSGNVAMDFHTTFLLVLLVSRPVSLTFPPSFPSLPGGTSGGAMGGGDGDTDSLRDTLGISHCWIVGHCPLRDPNAPLLSWWLLGRPAMPHLSPTHPAVRGPHWAGSTAPQTADATSSPELLGNAAPFRAASPSSTVQATRGPAAPGSSAGRTRALVSRSREPSCWAARRAGRPRGLWCPAGVKPCTW